jgi:hypothetical protein
MHLGPPAAANDDPSWVLVPITIATPDLHARTFIELHGWGGWTVGMAAFFRGLADTWRGWAGTRAWHDDEAANVEFEATHDGLGTVTFHVTLDAGQGWPTDGRDWIASVIIHVDAGALPILATSVESILGPPACAVPYRSGAGCRSSMARPLGADLDRVGLSGTTPEGASIRLIGVADQIWAIRP